ncbi:mitochondrial F1-F0 ATP synthase subunit F of fungi-domain-containing protein [Vararia minispora EC-137]|uniref:Mitochondrial F1-F0 ATP synthase subunit F of fungi-domain-containing protein n=1 Tax=Vararia minispora EC-137 TaxID=1314806 RepID=A0ACB8QTP7_9AGAM|nr:mitochondrial F1-F0 ATP synthase subunit F of fungi-domain-containing protein [Vararia minispora EC-137]
MRASFVSRQLGGIVPPKVAAPSILSSGTGSDLTPLVSFYSKLPKGPAPPPPAASLKARLFDGKAASGKPVVALLAGIFLIGYTLDYQKHHKNHAH